MLDMMEEGERMDSNTRSLLRVLDRVQRFEDRRDAKAKDRAKQRMIPCRPIMRLIKRLSKKWFLGCEGSEQK